MCVFSLLSIGGDAVASDSGPSSPLIVIAHELFDALPVHQFQYSAARKAWAERLIDVIPGDSTQAVAPLASVSE